jgi:hypothetical protein
VQQLTGTAQRSSYARSVHTGGGGTVFEQGSLHIDFGDGPVFDAYPIESTTDPSSTPTLTTASADTSSTPTRTPSTMVPVFNTKIDYDHVTDATVEFIELEFDTSFAFSDKEPGDLSPAHTSSVLDGDLLFHRYPGLRTQRASGTRPSSS